MAPTIRIFTRTYEGLADTVTPVSMYARVRDLYPGTLLLESADYHGAENSLSYLCVNPIATYSVGESEVEVSVQGRDTKRHAVSSESPLALLKAFCSQFEFEDHGVPSVVNGFFGYTAYDAVRFFETVPLRERDDERIDMPLVHYALFEYLAVIDHFHDRLYLLQNRIDGMPDDPEALVRFRHLLRRADVPEYPFRTRGPEESVMTDDEHRAIIIRCKEHIKRGDVFQIVPSRRFQVKFDGDEFNVYRMLRSINPSPFLFYFDYGTFRIFGSSPEAQIVVRSGQASIHPIAGTYPRGSGGTPDRVLADKLLADPKENAEHVMLVDLARNDLSVHCTDVTVEVFREVQFYSHLIHLVSKVTGTLEDPQEGLKVMASTFPAGTLSGAPKYRAMELIDKYEPHARRFYGGCIGVLGSNGEVVQAIMIRTFLSQGNTLYYQAGSGIVADSDPDTEVTEVRSKLGALTKAIATAGKLV